MGINPGDRQSPNWLALWWGRRFEYRQQIELAVIDMYDRYGAAAYGIARNSARARGGAEHRRFWSLVAPRPRRPGPGQARLLVWGPAARIWQNPFINSPWAPRGRAAPPGGLSPP